MDSSSLTDQHFSLTDSRKSKDFIEQLKDFLNESILELQAEGKIPIIIETSKQGTPRGGKK